MFDQAHQADTAKARRELQAQPGEQVVHWIPPEGYDVNTLQIKAESADYTRMQVKYKDGPDFRPILKQSAYVPGAIPGWILLLDLGSDLVTPVEWQFGGADD